MFSNLSIFGLITSLKGMFFYASASRRSIWHPQIDSKSGTTPQLWSAMLSHQAIPSKTGRGAGQFDQDGEKPIAAHPA